MSRLSKVVVVGLTAIIAAIATGLYLRTKFEIVSSNKNKTTVVSAPVRVQANEILEPDMSSTERRLFLAGNYAVVRKVADLPIQMQIRYAMADPGERFEATDMIMDSTLSRRRLIFAGVLPNRAFIHYEQGGIAHTYVTELLLLQPPETTVVLWRGYCGRTETLADLRGLAEHCN